MKFIYLLPLALLLGACSDDSMDNEPAKAAGDHVWKQQTDTLDKARGVEDTIMQGVQRRDESINTNN